MPLENEPTNNTLKMPRCKIRIRSENPDVAAVQNDCPSKIGWASFCELREHTIVPLLNRMTNISNLFAGPFFSLSNMDIPLSDMDRTFESYGFRYGFRSRTCHGSWAVENLSRRSIEHGNSFGFIQVRLGSLGLKKFPRNALLNAIHAKLLSSNCWS